jgi:tetratricopeptide (TPR) repeat protein
MLQLSLFANDTTYYAVIRKDLRQTEISGTVENYLVLANTCERIMNLKPNEWLPIYYKTYALLKIGELTSDENKKDDYFDNAQKIIDMAFNLKIKESEICVLQAYIYFSKMGINSMLRGPIYFPKAKEMLSMAETLNPENPRAIYLKAQSLFYTPGFMGGGKEAAKPVNEKAFELFKKFSPVSDIHPKWGKSNAEKLQKKLEQPD